MRKDALIHERYRMSLALACAANLLRRLHREGSIAGNPGGLRGCPNSFAAGFRKNSEHDRPVVLKTLEAL